MFQMPVLRSVFVFFKVFVFVFVQVFVFVFVKVSVSVSALDCFRMNPAMETVAAALMDRSRLLSRSLR